MSERRRVNTHSQFLQARLQSDSKIALRAKAADKVYVKAATQNETVWDVSPRSYYAKRDELSTRPGGLSPSRATATKIPGGQGYYITAPGTARQYHAFQGGHDPVSGQARTQWDVHEKHADGVHRQTSAKTRAEIAKKLSPFRQSNDSKGRGHVFRSGVDHEF